MINNLMHHLVQYWQGLPEGHTAACWPLLGPGVTQHRGRELRDSDADLRDRRRYALIGNAVTTQVCGCGWVGG
jgi:hypothetical protein